MSIAAFRLIGLRSRGDSERRVEFRRPGQSYRRQFRRNVLSVRYNQVVPDDFAYRLQKIRRSDVRRRHYHVYFGVVTAEHEYLRNVYSTRKQVIRNLFFEQIRIFEPPRISRSHTLQYFGKSFRLRDYKTSAAFQSLAFRDSARVLFEKRIEFNYHAFGTVAFFGENARQVDEIQIALRRAERYNFIERKRIGKAFSSALCLRRASRADGI